MISELLLLIVRLDARFERGGIGCVRVCVYASSVGRRKARDDAKGGEACEG
jgi:hypothetical protein